MAQLTAKSRSKIPTKEFALPKERKFPIENASHAANAKARAKQQLDAGRLSQGQYERIIGKADAKLKRG